MSNQDKNLLPELNALIDGELDHEGQSRLRRRLEQDPAARRHLAELRRVRALVHCAFRAEGAREKKRGTLFAARWAAAVALIVIGFGLGWGLRPAGTAALSDEIPKDRLALRALQPTGAEAGVLIHIDTADSAYVAAALDRVEAMLDRYARNQRRVSVELVANAGAVDLLRADASPHGRRLQALRERHVNLTLVACKTTLERLRRERGNLHLIPNVDAKDSALERILSRLEQGWIYVRA